MVNGFVKNVMKIELEKLKEGQFGLFLYTKQGGKDYGLCVHLENIDKPEKELEILIRGIKDAIKCEP